MCRVLQGILMMGTSHLQCRPLQYQTVLWSLPRTLLLGVTQGTLLLAAFRGFSGHLLEGKGAGRGMIRGGLSADVILEEGSYHEFEDKGFTRRFQALIAVFTFVVVFTVFCLIIWGASRPYKAEVTVKSLTVHNLYVGEGSDSTGVPTKMLTVNGTLRMSIYNPATFFGIHVHSTPINLVFSDITVATGELKKYYQPRKSHRIVSVNLEGNKVPLYGAGSIITVSQTGLEVPLTLSFEIRSRGNVVGKLVKTKHHKEITCPLVINSSGSKPIKLKRNSCTYE
ncbi:Late embryogenesis abundant protein, LEA-14 [Spatholobus suberectus]|nr:Late embryogenesis abundant protein, LEA-14 [Spatholobus suberectus]